MKSNIEKMRTMSAVELASFLCDASDCGKCKVESLCHFNHNGWLHFLTGTMTIEELEEE